MTTTNTPRLTQQAFDKLIFEQRSARQAGRPFTDAGIELARKVLVDGLTYAQAAAAVDNVNRQLVYQAVQRVLKYYVAPKEGQAHESHSYTGPSSMFVELDAVAKKHGGGRS